MKVIGRLFIQEFLDLMPANVPPLPMEGGLYYDNIDKQYYGCKDGINWTIISGKHNDLLGLQGGDPIPVGGEFYHLTSAEHTAATRDATNAVNGLMPSGKLTHWDAAYTHISNNGSDHSYINQDVKSSASPSFAGLTLTGDADLSTAARSITLKDNDANALIFKTSAIASLLKLDTTTGAPIITIGGKLIVTRGLEVQGTLTYINTTDLEVKDKLIRVNKGGLAASGDASGIEIEESGSVTGYVKTSADRAGWDFKEPAGGNVASIKPTATAAISLGANLTVSGASTVNQDVSSSGTPSFAGAELTTTPLKLDAISSPVAIPAKGQVYAKTATGSTELYYFDPAGNEVQLTKNGKPAGGMIQLKGCAYVGLSGYTANYNTIQDAINAIYGTGAGDGSVNDIAVGVLSASNRWTVLVAPGIYTIVSTIVNYPYIDIIGLGTSSEVIVSAADIDMMSYTPHNLIKNISFNLTSPSAARTLLKNKTAIASPDLVIENCKANFVGSYDSIGIEIYRPNESNIIEEQVIVRNCDFIGSVYLKGYGIRETSGTSSCYLKVAGCNFSSNLKGGVYLNNGTSIGNTAELDITNSVNSGGIYLYNTGANGVGLVNSSGNIYNGVSSPTGSSGAVFYGSTGTAYAKVYSSGDLITGTPILYSSVGSVFVDMHFDVNSDYIYSRFVGSVKKVMHFNHGTSSTEGTAILKYTPYKPANGGATLEIEEGGSETDNDFTLKALGAGKVKLVNDVQIALANYTYLGDASTNGSWRFYVSGTNLVFERRIGGVWVNKGSFAG